MDSENVVLQRRRGNPQSALEAPDLRDTPLEAAPQYLTSRQLAAYLGYGGQSPECTANQFTKRHGLRRYWRSPRAALVLRADVDRVLEGKAVWSRHASTVGR